MSLGFHQRKSIWNCHLQNYSHFAYVSLCSRTLTSACWGSVWWLLCTPCSHFAWCGTSAGAGPAPPAWGPPPRAPPPSPRHDLGCDSSWNNTRYDIDGLVQERRNSSALAMELRLSCTNPSVWSAFALPCWLISEDIQGMPQTGMSPWRPLPGLLSRCPGCKVIEVNSSGDCRSNTVTLAVAGPHISH